MATVHTAYGPGKIVDQETVRGRTQFKVAGDGFEVWLDETKIASADGEDFHRALPGGWPGDDDHHAPILEEEFPDHPMVENPELGRNYDHRRLDDYADPDDFHLQMTADRRQAWAPVDRSNSTTLPYNPDPQHNAIGELGEDGSATLQPIHHIDADERLSPSNSLSFDEEGDGEEPAPNPDLFAKQGGLSRTAIPTVLPKWVQDRVRDMAGDKITDGLMGAGAGKAVGHGINYVDNEINKVVDAIGPGEGWGDLIKGGSLHEATPAALLPALLRAVGPSVAGGLLGGGSDDGPGIDDMGPGEGWGDLVKDASYRPAGLSDKYIDITAGADYHNDPVAQFRHDPDAYINRVGQVMDEGLNPRFAEYMDLVEADSGIRTAAWKDVRKKAMRLKREGHVTVQDIAPNRIMASVVGDHGTYDVVILKGSSFGGLKEGNPGHAIANWHCGCEWGRWAFRRKFSYVGRLCSHAYASYLTMQSAALKGKPRQPKGPKRKAPSRNMYFPTRNTRHADNLQNGPQRLTPDLVVNDTDDAHMFLDVTKDEREDVGPDDVVSEKDIVHFARIMQACEANERPYPRELVAFLSRYAGCNDDSSDDTQADYKAHDATDANEYLEEIRSDADRKQEEDFGSMAERVHKIQDAVEEARAHGADADRFVASVRTAAEDDETAPPGFKAVPGGAPGTKLYRENPSTPAEAFGRGNPDRGIQVGPNGDKRQVKFDGGGTQGVDGNKYTYDGGAYSGPRGKTNPDQFVRDFAGQPPAQEPAVTPAGPGDPRLKNYNNGPNGINPNNPGGTSPKEAPNKSNADQPKGGAPGGQAPAAGDQGGKAGGSGGQSAGGQSAGGQGSGGGYTAPGGGQTTGPVADGGKAGAENGNNEAITGNEYTVQAGDTLTDIAQRAYGDMNRYQDIAKGNSIGNVDNLEVGTKIKLDNAQGNNGVRGDVTNPAGGGPDKNPATQDFEIGLTSPSGNTVSTAQGFAGGAPKADTPAAPASTTDTASSLVGKGIEPAQQNAIKPAASRRRVAAPGDGSQSDTSGQNGQTNTTAPTTAAPANPAAPTAPAPGVAAPPTGAQPGGANSPGTGTRTPQTVGPSKENDTFDPNNPAQADQEAGTGEDRNGETAAQNPSMGVGAGGMGGMDALSGIGDIASGIGSALPDLASGAMQAAPAVASGVGDALSGLASGLGSIFASKQDFDDWVRYAYPTADGEGDLDPHTHPFAGSGYPGPLEFGTSEEYADKARAKADDVTDLGSGDLTKPMGDWQKQSSLDDDDPYREASIGYSTDDDSDIVRRFQAHLGETALGEGAGSGAGRFDDIAGAAQGFLRTAGRNYSLAEQSELIREGDKGGARNLDSLDLTGTHYEDMHTLGW